MTILDFFKGGPAYYPGQLLIGAETAVVQIYYLYQIFGKGAEQSKLCLWV